MKHVEFMHDILQQIQIKPEELGKVKLIDRI